MAPLENQNSPFKAFTYVAVFCLIGMIGTTPSILEAAIAKKTENKDQEKKDTKGEKKSDEKVTDEAKKDAEDKKKIA